MKATEKNIYGLRYLKSLKEGERVVETGMCATWGAIGVVYKSKVKGHGMCVMWNLPEGQMGTSITHGTRRVRDVLRDAYNAIERGWGVIANASQGDWRLQSKEWVDAASRWRDRYVLNLPSVLEKCLICDGKGKITKGRIMPGENCPSCSGSGSRRADLSRPALTKIWVVFEISDDGHEERRVSQHLSEDTARKEAARLTKDNPVLRYVATGEEVLP